MAYLTFAGSDDKKSCFKFIGANTEAKSNVRLISSNVSLISDNTNILSSNSELDTCSFYYGPSNAAIGDFCEDSETCGTVAYSGTESCGSIAYSGGSESCGSIASSSASSGSSFSDGCSYSC